MESTPIQFLKKLYPALGGAQVRPYSGRKLPFWLRQNVQILLVQAREDLRLALVFPKGDIDYEQIVKIRGQVEKRLGTLSLIVADHLNPKYRSLFVNHRVPFVYKDEGLYAPELGIKLFQLKKRQETEKIQKIEENINPFELKILAGYLTGFFSDFQKPFKLTELRDFLKKHQYECSLGKLSQTVNGLIDKGLLEKTGSGPHRRLFFKMKQETWENLNTLGLKLTHKTMKGVAVKMGAHVYAGETALAQFSNLAKPNQETFAVTSEELKQIRDQVKNRDTANEGMVFYEVRKEDPRLFSMKDYLNPIEVYFSLRDHPDERIQISLKQMLKAFNLEHE